MTLTVCMLLPPGLFAQDAARYDVVIQEIFADPSPSRGLPSYEYLEVRNRSAKTLNLKNFGISNGSTFGKIQANILLKPDSLLILCPSSALSQFAGYGPAAALSPFPALDNDGDTLVLISAGGQVLHGIAWNKNWYADAVKELGGWSLEMKDPRMPWMNEGNWTASRNMTGGTPGTGNSVDTTLRDSTAPEILYSFMQDSLSVTVLFSEPPDSLLLTHLPVISPAQDILSATLDPPLYNSLRIRFQKALPEKKIFRMEFEALRDLAQNHSPQAFTEFGRSSPPAQSDIVINEILFDPPSSGYDYVELLNRSDKIIHANELLLANRNSAGRAASITTVSPEPFPVFPGEYLVITEGSNWLRNNFHLVHREKILECQSLPSFPNDAGTVLVLDTRGQVLDELAYDARWHFPLITNLDGVSLERINPHGPTQDPENWHSASSVSGYGTPGRQNSQFIPNRLAQVPVTVSSPVISPDQDGRDDILLVSYHFPQPGYVARVTVYDEMGRPVIILANRALCGTEGQFRWNGLDAMGRKLHDGFYIILTEVFNLSGMTKTYKHPVAMVHAR